MTVGRSHRPGGTRADLPRGGQALAPHPQLGGAQGPRLQPTRAAIVARYTAPPDGVAVSCADELGPVTPRTFPPPPGWSADGHRIKVPLEYGRGPEQVWVYGALRVGTGRRSPLTARSRNTAGDLPLLEAIARGEPGWRGAGDHRQPGQPQAPADPGLARGPSRASSTSSSRWRRAGSTCRRPGGGSVRRAALAGQSFANDREIDQATTVATAQLNRRAKPWVWGRPPKPHRHLRRLLVYRI